MKTSLKAITLIAMILFCVRNNGYCQDSLKIRNLMTEVNYGVPSSPAFELLPGKPSEVTHLSSPHDISASFGNFVDGNKLRLGAAVDARPFAYLCSSLDQYAKHYLRQLLWRTTFAAGTTTGSENKNDVFIGLGLRVSIVDEGDPRKDKIYIKNLDDAYIKALFTIAPTNPNTETAADFQKRLDEAANAPEVQKIRDDFNEKNWNALRWDLGVGVSDRAANGYLKADSIFKDRVGVWTALGYPLGKFGQLTFSGNTAWVSHKSDTTERNRSVIGTRVRFFLGSSLSLSGEYARIFSSYANHGYDENWGHLAIVAEVKVPKLGGWLGLAYGGDSAHRTDSGTKFSINYAIYTDRLIKK